MTKYKRGKPKQSDEPRLLLTLTKKNQDRLDELQTDISDKLGTEISRVQALNIIIQRYANYCHLMDHQYKTGSLWLDQKDIKKGRPMSQTKVQKTKVKDEPRLLHEEVPYKAKEMTNESK